MIRVNLVEHLTSPYESLLAPPAKSKSALPLVLLVVAALLGGGAWWWMGQNSSQQEALAAASAPKAEVKKVEVAPPQQRVSLAAERSAAIRMVDLVARHTPVGVALSDLVLQSSGNFLFRGVADDSLQVVRFSEALRKESLHFKAPVDEAVAPSKRAWAFVRYGQMPSDLPQTEACKELAPSLKEVMGQFDQLAQKAGLLYKPYDKLRSETALDHCTEVTVVREVIGSFSTLTALLKEVEKRNLAVGIVELKMQADHEEQMMAQIEMTLRYAPQKADKPTS